VTAALGFKRLGLAIVALVATGFGALALMSFLTPSESAREAVKAQIRAVTGIDPVLRGPVTVSLFPYGTVNFTDVVLGDDRYGDPPLTAERLTANLQIIPLFLGRVEIADISLLRPQIAVTFDGSGRSNWSALLETLARTLKPSAESTEPTMSFSEIRIAQGKIDVRDAAHGVTETLNDVALSLAWPSISKSFGATGRVVWRDEPLDTSVNIGDFLSALTGGRSSLRLRVAGAPGKLAFEGAMAGRPSFKIEGALGADAPALRQALQWLGQRPLPGGGFGRFALKAQTSIVGGSFALSGVHVELDGNAAEGVLTFVGDGRQTVQGTLAADALDLTPYISTARLLAGNARDWDWRPIALEGLTGVDLDLRLSARQVTVANAKFGRTAVATNLRGGKLNITIGESQAFGGVVKGSLGLAKSDTGADLKAQMNFAEVDLENCLGEIFGLRRVEGKGTLAFAIEGAGSSVLALTRTLNGSATLAGRDGSLTGFNAEQLLRRLERRPLSGGGDFRSGRTPFNTLNVALKISQGTVLVEEMRLDGASVRLALGGTASIPSRDLDLKGMASLLTSVTDQAPAFELPFVVQGPWDDPLMLPDAQSLIRRSGAAAPLLDRLNDRKTREAVDSAIRRLTGQPATAKTPSPPAPPSEPQPTSQPAE